jgi:hypothetical protein
MFMARISLSQTFLGTALLVVSLFLSGCTSSASNRYFGGTTAPAENVLRYISGSERNRSTRKCRPDSRKPAF